MIKFFKILLVILLIILLACIGLAVYSYKYKDYKVEADDKLVVNIDTTFNCEYDIREENIVITILSKDTNNILICYQVNKENVITGVMVGGEYTFTIEDYKNIKYNIKVWKKEKN